VVVSDVKLEQKAVLVLVRMDVSDKPVFTLRK